MTSGALTRFQAARLAAAANMLLQMAMREPMEGGGQVGQVLEQAPETFQYLSRGQRSNWKIRGRALKKAREALVDLEAAYGGPALGAAPVGGPPPNLPLAPLGQPAGPAGPAGAAVVIPLPAPAQIPLIPLAVPAAHGAAAAPGGAPGAVQPFLAGLGAPTGDAFVTLLASLATTSFLGPIWNSPPVLVLRLFYYVMGVFMVQALPRLLFAATLCGALGLVTTAVFNQKLFVRLVVRALSFVPELLIAALSEAMGQLGESMFAPEGGPCPAHCLTDSAARSQSLYDPPRKVASQFHPPTPATPTDWTTIIIVLLGFYAIARGPGLGAAAPAH